MKPNAILAIALFASAPAFAQTAATPAAKPATPAVAPSTIKHVEAAPLDINTATVEQLSSAKGLNKALAEAIVKGRPYKSADELVKNKILTEAVFAQVKDQLTVKHN